jgi:hypothetical protein
MGKRQKDGRAPVTVGATTAAILAGEIDLSEWDDDEIMRGQRKSKDGRFHGRPPKVVAQAVHEERHKRFFQRGVMLLRTNASKAAEYLIRVVGDESVPHSDRIKAATFIIERVYGRAPEHVAIAIEEPAWMKALKDSIVGIVPGMKVVDIRPNANVVDAEAIEGDDAIELENEPVQPRPDFRDRPRVSR